MFRPVSTRRAFEDAAAQIAQAVRAGELPVGARLPSERELAEQMQINRLTLREAIKVLRNAGVIEVQPGPRGGMYVQCEFVPRELLGEGSELSLQEVSGVFEARRMLEPRVAQLAGVHGIDDDLDAMQRAIDSQRAHRDDRERFIQLDRRFHFVIAQATHNRTIVEMMRDLLGQLELARDTVIRGTHQPDEEIALHELTLVAIRGGDVDEIDQAIDAHLGFLEEIWLKESGRALLRQVPAFLWPYKTLIGGVKHGAGADASSSAPAGRSRRK